jgi:hypothetical protein
VVELRLLLSLAERCSLDDVVCDAMGVERVELLVAIAASGLTMTVRLEYDRNSPPCHCRHLKWNLPCDAMVD